MLAALYERDGPNGTVQGQHIDIALLDCTIAAQTHAVMTYLAAGVVPPRRGTKGLAACRRRRLNAPMAA